jgi:DNA (cytosine-5)-methyltransferase 1
MTDLTAVNAFAGIGGFDRALAQVGVRSVAAIEIDPAPGGVLNDQFPDTTLFSDICEVTADDIRAAGFVPERGILTAGWPCQDLSVAGRRLGLGGTRSGLFWEVIRLLAELRPRWFVLENVPGLLSAVCSCPGLGCCPGWFTYDEYDNETYHPCDDPHAIRGGACGFDGTRGRCMELHGGAMGAVLGALVELGYGVAYRVLDAQYFGVPQRRRRVIFVGCLGDWAAPAQVLLEPDCGAGDSAAGGEARAGTSAVSALGASDGGPDDNDATGGRLIAGTLGSRVGGSRTTDLDNHGAYVPVPAVTAKWAKGTGGPAGDEAQNLVPWTVSDHANPVIGAGRIGALQVGTGAVPAISTVEPIAFDWQSDGSDRVRGNISTLRTSSLGTTNRDAIADAVAVRRLTPVECERLQGFPDGWTATSWGKPQSDSARYRELGNSVAVPVFTWVGRRLVAVDSLMKAVAA